MPYRRLEDSVCHQETPKWIGWVGIDNFCRLRYNVNMNVFCFNLEELHGKIGVHLFWSQLNKTLTFKYITLHCKLNSSTIYMSQEAIALKKNFETRLQLSINLEIRHQWQLCQWPPSQAWSLNCQTWSLQQVARVEREKSCRFWRE